MLQKYDGIKFLTTTDLTSGYWQIPLSRESRKYTAFRVGSALYQFRRVPFGLKTASSAFIRAINMVLGDYLNTFLTIYVDDLLITSRSFDEHIKHLELLFNRLKKHNLKLKFSKSLFCRFEVPYLGIILPREGIKPDPEKLK